MQVPDTPLPTVVLQVIIGLLHLNFSPHTFKVTHGAKLWWRFHRNSLKQTYSKTNEYNSVSIYEC
jgi:hypothetical protein